MVNCHDEFTQLHCLAYMLQSLLVRIYPSLRQSTSLNLLAKLQTYWPSCEVLRINVAPTARSTATSPALQRKQSASSTIMDSNESMPESGMILTHCCIAAMKLTWRCN